MNKPITVQINDFQVAISKAIEQSQLPAVIIRQTLAEFLERAKVVEKMQYKEDMKIWMNSQKKDEEQADPTV